MKKMDVDAKQMIRDYIDSIDEYMKEKTNLHPNEIDGLLNEINDFIYLRSKEISTNKKIHFKDILKAIDECGSPSEICEQYTDLNEVDKGKKFTPKGSAAEDGNIESDDKLNTISLSNFASAKRDRFYWVRNPFRAIFSLMKAFPSFILFRITSILCYISWLIFLLLYFTLFINENWDNWLYNGEFGYIDPGEAFDFFFIANIFFLISFLLFIIIEGVLIDFLKSFKVNNQNYNRKSDDTAILFISRLSFLLLLLKSSILLNFYYIPLIPFWIILTLFIERKFKSELWNKKISPIFISIGLRIEGGSSTENRITINSFYERFRKTKFDIYESIIILFLAIPFGLSFLWPWIRLRTVEITVTNYYLPRLVNSLILDNLPYDAYILPYLFLIPVFLTLLYSISIRVANKFSLKTHPHESSILIWLMRLISIRIVLIIITFTKFPSTFGFRLNDRTLFRVNDQITIDYMGYFTLLILWLLFEIVIIEYRRDFFIRKRIGQGFLFVGGSDPKKLIKATTDKESTVVAEIIPLTKEEEDELKPDKPQRGPTSNIGLAFRALFSSLSIFLIIAFQVWIGYCFSKIFLNDPPFLFYTVLLLGIQVLILATIVFYKVSSNTSEGIVLKTVRTWSRICLILLISFSIMNPLIYDSTNLMTFIVLGLLAFNEMVAWKIRSERRKLDKEINKSHYKENQLIDRGILNKISRYL